MWNLKSCTRRITDKRKINEIKSLCCVTYFVCKVLLDDFISATVSLKSKLHRYPEMQLCFWVFWLLSWSLIVTFTITLLSSAFPVQLNWGSNCLIDLLCPLQ